MSEDNFVSFEVYFENDLNLASFELEIQFSGATLTLRMHRSLRSHELECGCHKLSFQTVFVFVHVNIMSHLELFFSFSKRRFMRTNSLQGSSIPIRYIQRPHILTFIQPSMSVNAKKPPTDHCSFCLMLNPIILRRETHFDLSRTDQYPQSFCLEHPHFSSS